MNLIPELTKNCQREDCSIVGGSCGVSTLVAWTPTYDKHGNRTDRGDPNTFTTTYKCVTCGASWSATTQYGETKITPRNEPCTS